MNSVRALNGKASSLKIESGVPLPPKRGDDYAILKKMKRGQSILFPAGTQPLVRAAAARIFGKGGYAIRTMKDGARLWRMK